MLSTFCTSMRRSPGSGLGGLMAEVYRSPSQYETTDGSAVGYAAAIIGFMRGSWSHLFTSPDLSGGGWGLS